MSRCETCIHWAPPSQRDGYGDALQVVPPNGYNDRAANEAARQAQHEADLLFGQCGAIFLREITLGDPVPLAVTMDASEYQATLYTQARFGCAMWEPAQ